MLLAHIGPHWPTLAHIGPHWPTIFSIVSYSQGVQCGEGIERIFSISSVRVTKDQKQSRCQWEPSGPVIWWTAIEKPFEIWFKINAMIWDQTHAAHIVPEGPMGRSGICRTLHLSQIGEIGKDWRIHRFQHVPTVLFSDSRKSWCGSFWLLGCHEGNSNAMEGPKLLQQFSPVSITVGGQGSFYWQRLSLGDPWSSEEENQKLKEMIQSLGAGRTVDAQTFEDLGRKPGNPVHWCPQSPWWWGDVDVMSRVVTMW